MRGTLYLVNRDHPLSVEPEQELLAPLDGGSPPVLLHRRAGAMLEQLLSHVGGGDAVVPVSGYRPRAEQQAIWDSSLAEHGQAFTETYVARPGCSEHQTGLARGKEDVTGIGHEPWHFRYVGWPHARLMEERGLVLEEYLAWLHAFPLGGEPLRYQGLGRRIEISYVPTEAAADLKLPADLPCQMSDTNEGGVVLTVWRDAG